MRLVYAGCYAPVLYFAWHNVRGSTARGKTSLYCLHVRASWVQPAAAHYVIATTRQLRASLCIQAHVLIQQLPSAASGLNKSVVKNALELGKRDFVRHTESGQLMINRTMHLGKAPIK